MTDFARLQRVFLTLAVALTVLQIRLVRHTSWYGQDVLAVWSATQNLWNGDPVYNRVDGVLPFMYTPSGALFMAPLGLVSLSTAKSIVLVLLTASMLTCVYIVAGLITSRHRLLLSAATVCLLAVTFPFTDALSNLNPTGFVLPCLALCLWGWTQKRYRYAAVALGISLTIKPLLIPLVLIPLLLRRPRDLVWVVAIPLLLNTIALLVITDRGAFFSDTLPLLVSSDVGALGVHNISIFGVGNSYDWSPVITTILRLLALAVCVGGAYRCARSQTDATLRMIEACSLLLIGLLLAGSINQPHYCLLLIPLVMSVAKSGSRTRSALFALGFCLSFSALELPYVALSGSASSGVLRMSGLALMAVGVASFRSNSSYAFAFKPRSLGNLLPRNRRSNGISTNL